MLSPRENLLRVLNHEEAEYVPCGLIDMTFTGFSAPFEKGPPGGGRDAFGVRWSVSDAGSSQPLPAPGEFILTDITAWKKQIAIPNPDDFEWERDAERDLAPYDTNTVVVDYGSGKPCGTVFSGDSPPGGRQQFARQGVCSRLSAPGNCCRAHIFTALHIGRVWYN
jgi:hypothetical protein